MSPDPKHRCTFAIAVAPDAVDAGCCLSLTATVRGLDPGLTRPVVVVCDGEGAERARAGLECGEDGALGSGEIVVAVPRAVGPYVWRAAVVATGADGAACEQAAAEVCFRVVPHTLNLAVWDVPPVVVAGKKIKLQAGIKCSGGCAMGGETLSVADAQGRLLATTRFTDERWPETEAIYAAEVEIAVPKAFGEYTWEITAAAHGLDLPHATATQQMTVTVVAAPDCVVTIEVRDKATQAPLAGARVALQPYRATTSSGGIATVPVAKGQYDLLVERRGYKPFSTRLNVRSEIFTMAVLEAEPLDGVDAG